MKWPSLHTLQLLCEIQNTFFALRYDYDVTEICYIYHNVMFNSYFFFFNFEIWALCHSIYKGLPHVRKFVSLNP